ncbi:MAG: hypothetical protein ACLU30_13800 [Odoribacter splanchnicus]
MYLIYVSNLQASLAKTKDAMFRENAAAECLMLLDLLSKDGRWFARG